MLTFFVWHGKCSSAGASGRTETLTPQERAVSFLSINLVHQMVSLRNLVIKMMGTSLTWKVL